MAEPRCYAVPVDGCRSDLAWTAECKECRWTVSDPSESMVRVLAAAHLEETAHRAVELRAHGCDLLMAVPRLPKFEEQRVVPLQRKEKR